MRKFVKILFACLILTLVFGFSHVASAKAFHNIERLRYVVGVAPVSGPDISVADNGDRLEISGSGDLTLHPGSVNGGGTFVHKNASGDVIGTGTWTATKLLHFESFGTAHDFPPEFEGGIAVIRIHISPSTGGAGFNGILRITCLVGAHDDEELKEGVEVLVRRVINFDQAISGETLFIRQP